MTPDTFLVTALQPAFFLLPGKMDTPEARAMIVAIALQESKLEHRHQFGKGPGRSYFQFEKSGVRGVLSHQASQTHAKDVCAALDLVANCPAVHRAIEFNDALAVCFARLLLWTLPKPLPPASDPIEAWYQYLEAWRPGKPREASWAGNFTRAWAIIKGTS